MVSGWCGSHPVAAVWLLFSLSVGNTDCFQTVLRSRYRQPDSSRMFQASQMQQQPGPRTWVQRPGWPPNTTDQQRNLEKDSTLATATKPVRRRQKMKPLPVTGYDARAIEEHYDMRPLEVGWRLNSLGFPLLGEYWGVERKVSSVQMILGC